MLLPCRHKPPVRADGPSKTCTLLLNWCANLLWNVLNCVSAHSQESVRTLLSSCKLSKRLRNFPKLYRLGPILPIQKSLVVSFKRLFLHALHFKKKISPQKLHIALGVSSSQITIINRSISSSSWLGMARFISVRLGSACRANEALMSLGGLYSVKLPACF
jgi:hypothetical protein